MGEVPPTLVSTPTPTPKGLLAEVTDIDLLDAGLERMLRVRLALQRTPPLIDDDKLFTLLDVCVSSLRRGHANILCIVPSLTDDPRRESIPLVDDDTLLLDDAPLLSDDGESKSRRKARAAEVRVALTTSSCKRFGRLLGSAEATDPYSSNAAVRGASWPPPFSSASLIGTRRASAFIARPHIEAWW